MIGTAIVSIIAGPWYGVVTGLLSTAATSLAFASWHIPFALVRVAGALIWGFGIRSAIFNKSHSRFFLLNLITAAACTLIAVPIILFILHGELRSPFGDMVVAGISDGRNSGAAVLSVNLLLQVVDKVLTGAIALFIVELIVHKFRIQKANT